MTDQQRHTHVTLRPTVPELESWLEKETRVLDHGFIRVIDYMGDDDAIVQAARVSYGRGTKQVSEDTGLIRYLMRHRHSTPFEMGEIKFHVKLPIFVARQWIRHRTANVNEVSARYSILDKEFYIPAPENMGAQSTTNRQGREGVLDPKSAEWAADLLRRDASINYNHYDLMLGSDLARELARMNLTLNTYTQWYWKIDLHNLFNFLSLRADPHAQYEIRAYADVMLEIVKAWVPIAYQAFLDYRLNAYTLSDQQFQMIRDMTVGVIVPDRDYGMSKRESDEVLAALGR